MDRYEIFRKNVKTLLKERNISQSEMARGMKIPVSSLNNWLSGRRKPRINAVYNMILYLGVRLDTLLERDQE